MINIQCGAYLCTVLPLSSRELVRIAGKIISGLGVDDPSLDILVTHDGKMKELNRIFLGMEGPTNVLSFPEQGGQDTNSMGQLVINIDAIKREAGLYGQEPFSYLVRLMIHGILHLAGYEHGEVMDDTARRLKSLVAITI